jgi:1,4-dihydroxy-2-naphthoate polyprenyltransferase
MSANEHRVLPSDSPLVQQVLRDFRVQENGRRWVVRMRGEGRYRSSVFPEFNESGRRVLLEFIPEGDWSRPGILLRWGQAFRLPYLLFSLLPLLLVSSRFYAETRSFPLMEGVLLFLSVILVHLSCNLWSEYEDHLRGVDAPEHAGGTGVVQRLWIPAVQLRNCSAALMVLGAALGLWLLTLLPIGLVGSQLLWLSLAGGLGAASYSGWPFHYKYIGLGEPIVFLLSGPVVTLGASLIFFRDDSRFAFFALASIPLAFLAILRLHGGNMQRIPFDSMAGVFTIARHLGFFWSKLAFGFLLFAPFLSAMLLWAYGLVPHASVACGASLPFVLFSYMALKEAHGPLDPACNEFRRQASRLHLSFGLIYCMSFLFL